MYSKGTFIIYFLVYVGDILITATDSTLLDSIIAKLKVPFAMKNLS